MKHSNSREPAPALPPEDQIIRKAMDATPPEEIEAQLLRQIDDLRPGMEAAGVGWARDGFGLWRAPRRLAFAGALSGLAGLFLLFLILSQSTLTWAEVVQRFKSIRYFHASVVITPDPLSPPERIEVWVAGDGRARLHQRDHVVFAENRKVMGVFNVQSQQKIDGIDPEGGDWANLKLDETMDLVNILGRIDEFSLPALITFFGGEFLSDPLPNSDASIAEDMQIFDSQSTQSNEWMRVWVLKSSGLPIRFRNWSPRNGSHVDVTFDFTREQPAEAFDPSRYDEVLKQASDTSTRLYGLLKDPGGKTM